MTAWVVVAGTVLVGSGLIALSDLPPTDEPLSRAESLLPADGAATQLSYASGEEWVIESALSTGVGMFLQQPGVVWSHQVPRLEQAGTFESTRLWRQTWTNTNGDLGHLIELYERAPDGVRLLTLTGGANGFSFVPGLLVLPSDVADGATWSSEGDALPGPYLTYRSAGSARNADNGCLEVELRTSYFDPEADGALLLESVDTSLWCPGRGAISTSFTSNGEPGSTIAVPLAADRRLDADPAPARIDLAPLAAVDEPRAVSFVTRDPLFGEMLATNATDGTVAAVNSGVVAVLIDDDVVGYRAGAEPPEGVADTAAAERAWIIHPGGRVTELGAVGNAVLVATTERRLIAYDDSGARAWSTGFADVILDRVVPDGDDGLIAVALDGEVRRIDFETGATRWSAQLGDAPAAQAAVAGGVVYVVSRAGSLHAFDLEDGTELWSAETPKGHSVAVVGERVIVPSNDTSLLAFDATTGEPAWASSLDGLPQRIAVSGELVLVQTLAGTSAFDAAGQLRWQRPENVDLLSDGSTIGLVGVTATTLVDAVGRELATWNTPPVINGVSRVLTPVSGGVWLFGSDFTALEWSLDD